MCIRDSLTKGELALRLDKTFNRALEAISLYEEMEDQFSAGQQSMILATLKQIRQALEKVL